MRMKGVISVMVSALLFAQGCVDKTHLDEFRIPDGNSSKTVSPGKRTGNAEKRRVFLLYAAGFNTLSSYLRDDIADLEEGFIPGEGRDENVLLVFSKVVPRFSSYATEISPTLVRYYRDGAGGIVKDTLLVMPVGTNMAKAETVSQVLTFIRDNVPARSWGMVLSSHATGWLPEDYYNDPSKYEREHPLAGAPSGTRKSMSARAPLPGKIPNEPWMPAVKSVTQEVTYISKTEQASSEIELNDFVAAIPMKLDYIMFDACLMGGIEVAYALKEKCSHIAFSQTEVLAQGYEYKQIAGQLLGGEEADCEAVCRTFFDYYMAQSGQYKSATISLVRTDRLDAVAQACRPLFDKYRSELASMSGDGVQGYFRHERHYFYDLYDVVAKAGATPQELDGLKSAIGSSVEYMGATEEFLGIEINTFSGYSMYLPSMGTAVLDNFYKSLAWNEAAGLVM